MSQKTGTSSQGQPPRSAQSIELQAVPLILRDFPIACSACHWPNPTDNPGRCARFLRCAFELHITLGRAMTHQDMYSSYFDLAKRQVEGEAYRVTCVSKPSSSVAIIAPHGGKIEPKTSEIASSVAGENFNLYLFEGLLPDDNYAKLHLTSNNFDEPRCLSLIARCDTVVAIHGCGGFQPEVLLGGRNNALKLTMAEALRIATFKVRIHGHAFQGDGRENICNRGRTGEGLQIELTRGFRNSDLADQFVTAVRGVLLET